MGDTDLERRYEEFRLENARQDSAWERGVAAFLMTVGVGAVMSSLLVGELSTSQFRSMMIFGWLMGLFGRLLLWRAQNDLARAYGVQDEWKRHAPRWWHL